MYMLPEQERHEKHNQLQNAQFILQSTMLPLKAVPHKKIAASTEHTCNIEESSSHSKRADRSGCKAPPSKYMKHQLLFPLQFYTV